jgi:hypothetical protein
MTAVAIEVYRRALCITDTSQDTEIERVGNRAEAALTSYLGASSLDAFYYEHGEQAYFQMEAALCNIVVRTFDDPKEPPITDAVRAWLQPYRMPSVG